MPLPMVVVVLMLIMIMIIATVTHIGEGKPHYDLATVLNRQLYCSQATHLMIRKYGYFSDVQSWSFLSPFLCLSPGNNFWQS